MVVGVTTLNRLDYVQRFLDSFNETRSDDFDWIVVVADDGSTDATLPWLRHRASVRGQLVVVENKGATIAGQTNTIFEVASLVDFDFGFKCDDDIFFTKPGWDELYWNAARESTFDHLVYHNTSWKPATHELHRDGLSSYVAGEDCMGCFYTFSPRLLEEVGWLDERSFPVRGHAHIDFTMRACRTGFNEAEHIWDAQSSSDFVGMWTKEDYVAVFDWSSDAAKAITAEPEKARRWAIVRDVSRTHLDHMQGDVTRPASRVRVRPADHDLDQILADSGWFNPGAGGVSEFDGVFVINLRHDVGKFAVTSEMLTRHGLTHAAFQGVDGNDEAVASEWRDYASSGLTHPTEMRIGRKLIQSPGAWAYLSGMRNIIEHARAKRMKRILVFDDDIMIHTQFEELVTQYFDQLPEDWVLWLLGCTYPESASVTDASQDLVHPGHEFNGSFAFALDAAAFDLVLEHIDKREWPFDAGCITGRVHLFPGSGLRMPHTTRDRRRLGISDTSTARPG